MRNTNNQAVAINISPSVKELKYAGFWVRSLAFFLDLCLVYIPLSIVCVVTVDVDYMEADLFLRFILVILFKIIFGTYCGLFLSSSWQATPGKRAFGLYVIKQDGTKVSFLRGFFRCTIGYFFSNVIFGIGYIMVAFTKNKLSLHDVLLDTYVVKREG